VCMLCGVCVCVVSCVCVVCGVCVVVCGCGCEGNEKHGDI
jgi:hypothetical protein